jgi:hypothetical protein
MISKADRAIAWKNLITHPALMSHVPNQADQSNTDCFQVIDLVYRDNYTGINNQKE